MHMKAHANDLTHEQCSSLAGRMGFAVTSYEVTLEYTMTKSLWYETLRKRYTSFVRQFTDEEMEEGIRELEMGMFQELKEDSEILNDIKDPVVPKLANL